MTRMRMAVIVMSKPAGRGPEKRKTHDQVEVVAETRRSVGAWATKGRIQQVRTRRPAARTRPQGGFLLVQGN